MKLFARSAFTALVMLSGVMFGNPTAQAEATISRKSTVNAPWMFAILMADAPEFSPDGRNVVYKTEELTSVDRVAYIQKEGKKLHITIAPNTCGMGSIETAPCKPKEKREFTLTPTSDVGIYLLTCLDNDDETDHCLKNTRPLLALIEAHLHEKRN